MIKLTTPTLEILQQQTSVIFDIFLKKFLGGPVIRPFFYILIVEVFHEKCETSIKRSANQKGLRLVSTAGRARVPSRVQK